MSKAEEIAKQFENSIGYKFKDPSLLVNALTHPSFTKSSFEILEFIGDRVINLVIAKVLFDSNPASEKEYARKFVGLTNKEALLQAGLAMKLDKYVLWIGDESHKQTIIQDATEAVIGAIFVDSNMETVHSLAVKIWQNVKDQDFSKVDPKSMLQSWASKRKLEPVYEVQKISGPPHARNYVVELSVPGHEGFIGSGSSIRNAQQDAAGKFIKRYELVKRD